MLVAADPAAGAALAVYPLGSFLLQLAKTKSAWLRMGGSPRACDTSQKGTARWRGRTWGAQSTGEVVPQLRPWEGGSAPAGRLWPQSQGSSATCGYLHGALLALLPQVAHGDEAEHQMGQVQLLAPSEVPCAQLGHLQRDPGEHGAPQPYKECIPCVPPQPGVPLPSPLPALFLSLQPCTAHYGLTGSLRAMVSGTPGVSLPRTGRNAGAAALVTSRGFPLPPHSGWDSPAAVSGAISVPKALPLHRVGYNQRSLCALSIHTALPYSSTS